MNILALGDLHGRLPKIHIKKNEFDIIILPGDICGDKIRYYINKLKVEEKKFKKKQNRLILKNIKNMGKVLNMKPPKITDFLSTIKLKNMDKDSLKEGDKILNFLNKLNKPIFLVAGNWDPTPNDGIEIGDRKDWENMLKKYKNIFDIENKKKNI